MSYPMRSPAKKRPDGETKAEVKKLYLAGISPRTIGMDLGISTSAVYQHIAQLRVSGELPEPQGAQA